MITDRCNKHIDDFLSLVSTWKKAYKLKVSSYVAIKTLDGPKLLFGRILLETGIPVVVNSPFQFESEHIIAGRETIKVAPDDIFKCINSAEKGKIKVASQSFSLTTPENTTKTFFPIYHPLLPFGPRLPTIAIWGVRKDDPLSKENFKRSELLDWELKAANQPFDNLDDLFAHLGLPGISQMGDKTTLEVVARSPAMISELSKISGGQAFVKCIVARGVDVKKIKLGYKLFHKNSVSRSSVAGKKFDWKIENDIQVGDIRIPVQGDVFVMQSFLSYDHVALHVWWVQDPQKQLNPRLATYKTFDEELELLNDFLFGPRKDRDRTFEHGIALLLDVLGFSVSHHGTIKKLENGPDIIAITPTGHIGVIECTTGLLNENDKLAKLALRTKLIRAKLSSAGHGFVSVQPVIISALGRSEVEAHIKEAGKNGIAVICKENLKNLVDRIILPPNPDGLFQEATQMVPKSDQP